MTPMDRNFTQFISYHEIDIQGIDLYEDAWGLFCEYGDMINLLRENEIKPGKRLTSQLMEKIRKQN
jgi:hypothetical protein